MALDAVLWDIEPELVDLAKRYNIGLHVLLRFQRFYKYRLYR